MTGFLMLGLQILILLNPFAVLSTFLSLTPDYTREERRQVVFRSTVTVILSSVLLYFSGGVIFSLFGINMDVFRIGGGVILMVCAVSLVAGKSGGSGGGGCGGEYRGGIGRERERKKNAGRSLLPARNAPEGTLPWSRSRFRWRSGRERVRESSSSGWRKPPHGKRCCIWERFFPHRSFSACCSLPERRQNVSWENAGFPSLQS